MNKLDYDRAGIAKKHGLSLKNLVALPFVFGAVFLFFVGVSSVTEKTVVTDMTGNVVESTPFQTTLHVYGRKQRPCRLLPGTGSGLIKRDAGQVWTEAFFEFVDDPGHYSTRPPSEDLLDFGFWRFTPTDTGENLAPISQLRVTLVHNCDGSPYLTVIDFDLSDNQ